MIRASPTTASSLIWRRIIGFCRRPARPIGQRLRARWSALFATREDFFLGRSFRNLDDLNAQFRHWLDTVANPRRHATTGRIVLEHFAEEQPYLKALPTMPFNVVLTLDRRVTREGMVSVGGDLYSVPLSDLATIMFEPKAGFLLACEPFAQLRPPPPRLRALDGDRQRLPLPDQHDQALSARDPRIDQISLQHRIMLRR